MVEDPQLGRITEEVAALVDISEKLGFETHVRSDYGDESQYRTPWELFDRSSAEEAVALALGKTSRS